MPDLGWLSPEQQAAIKALRGQAWTRPIVVEDIILSAEAPVDAYDEPELDTEPGFVMSGDYVWQPEHLGVGTAGGLADRADLILTVDIVYSGSLVPGTRVSVDGVRLEITTVSTYRDTGELVAQAKRVT